MPKMPVLLLAGALASAPVAAVDVTFTDEEREQCDAEGGCMIVTRLVLHKAQKAAFDAGKATCGAKV
jgi:hypothetical protein